MHPIFKQILYFCPVQNQHLLFDLFSIFANLRLVLENVF